MRWLHFATQRLVRHDFKAVAALAFSGNLASFGTLADMYS